MCNEQKWQMVCEEEDGMHFRRTERLQVPGGWMYRFETYVAVSEESNAYGVTMQYVPAPRPRAKVKKKAR